MDSSPDEAPSLLEAALRYWYVLVLAFVCFALLGFLATSTLPETYTATAHVALRDPEQRDVAGNIGATVDEYERLTRAEVNRARSPEVSQRVADEFGLDREDFDDDTVIQYVTAGLFSITVEAPTAGEAADRANALADAYQADRVTKAADSTAAEIAVLETYLDSERARLAEIEAELATLSEEAEAAAADEEANAGGGTDVATLAPRARLDATLSAIASVEEQIRDAEIRAALFTSGGVDFVDPAEVPAAPSSPSTARNTAAAALLGVFLTLPVVWLAMVRRGRADDATAVSSTLGAPVFGDVPAGALSSANPADAIDSPYRAFELIFAALQVNQRSALVVTGLGSAVETTFSAIQLGAVAAHSGLETVLVDGDLTGRRLTTSLGATGRPGLLEALESDEYDPGAVVPVSDPELPLYVLPTGESTQRRHLTPAGVEAVLEDLRADFDVVIVDGPPLLGSADALTLAAGVDGVVLMLPDRPRLSTLRTARERLELVETTVAGAILTAPDQGSTSVVGTIRSAASDRSSSRRSDRSSGSGSGGRNGNGSGNGDSSSVVGAILTASTQGAPRRPRSDRPFADPDRNDPSGRSSPFGS
ncbi:MAG: hypothetical protein AAGD18_02665 [Actinomycetota bacterium]